MNHQAIIIGGGQAGLAVSYYLSHAGVDHLVLERNQRVGDQWRARWDSLKLFTPAQYNHLPGEKFPAPKGSFANKDQVADYLEDYAFRQDLPLRFNCAVTEVRQQGGGYAVETSQGTFYAPQVVVATGAFQKPIIPHCSKDINEEVLQIHSSQYRNPQQLKPGKVLVVGAGNSGVQIAEELSRSHEVWLAGRDNGGLPRTVLGMDIYWWLKLSGIYNATVHSPVVKRLKAKGFGKGDPLVGRKLEQVVEKCGLKRLGKVKAAKNGQLIFEQGEVLDFPDNIIWATGFRPDFSWIKLPVFGEDGHPVHSRGVVEGAEGLYFIGLRLLYRLKSSLLGGVGDDARYTASEIVRKQQELNPAEDVVESMFS